MNQNLVIVLKFVSGFIKDKLKLQRVDLIRLFAIHDLHGYRKTLKLLVTVIEDSEKASRSNRVWNQMKRKVRLALTGNTSFDLSTGWGFGSHWVCVQSTSQWEMSKTANFKENKMVLLIHNLRIDRSELRKKHWLGRWSPQWMVADFRLLSAAYGWLVNSQLTHRQFATEFANPVLHAQPPNQFRSCRQARPPLLPIPLESKKKRNLVRNWMFILSR